MTILSRPSPSFDRRLAPPDMIVLHYTGMRTADAALERLVDPAAKVSAHWLIDEDGTIVSLVPEERRAWHAGVAFWRGVTDVNGASIGIELVNPGHEFGYRAFPRAQIEALLPLLEAIRGRWTIADEAIVGHSDVAPTRKEDPGELFPWKRLARAGHGLFVEPPPAPGAAMKIGDEGAAVFAFEAGLARLGYDLDPSGVYGQALATVVTAFQRHWRPSRLDGRADGATRARLMALLRLLP